MKNEGWFDSWLLLSAFRKKLASMGVHYLEGNISGISVGENRVRSVKVVSL